MNKKKLNEFLDRSVESLFPVQYRSYNEIMSGKDCIVQARQRFFSHKTLILLLILI